MASSDILLVDEMIWTLDCQEVIWYCESWIQAILYTINDKEMETEKDTWLGQGLKAEVVSDTVFSM